MISEGRTALGRRRLRHPRPEPGNGRSMRRGNDQIFPGAAWGNRTPDLRITRAPRDRSKRSPAVMSHLRALRALATWANAGTDSTRDSTTLSNADRLARWPGRAGAEHSGRRLAEGSRANSVSSRPDCSSRSAGTPSSGPGRRSRRQRQGEAVIGRRAARRMPLALRVLAVTPEISCLLQRVWPRGLPA
jgi:hypothetical protein